MTRFLEIPCKIAPRVLPPCICFSARILAKFAVGLRRDFSRRDYCFPARILVSFAPESRRDFGCRDFCFSARILARFAAVSRRDFGRLDFCFPSRILARFEARSRPGISPPGENLANPAGIPAEFPPRSRRDPAKIPVSSRSCA